MKFWRSFATVLVISAMAVPPVVASQLVYDNAVTQRDEHEDFIDDLEETALSLRDEAWDLLWEKYDQTRSSCQYILNGGTGPVSDARLQNEITQAGFEVDWWADQFDAAMAESPPDYDDADYAADQEDNWEYTKDLLESLD